MRYTLRFLLISFMFFILAVSDPTQAVPTEKASIVMNEKAVITGRVILLGDIASIESSDEELISTLKKIEICSAAGPGFSQTLHIGYIKSRMRQQGIIPNSIKWSGFERTEVNTKVQRLTPQELLSYAEAFIKTQRSKNSIHPVSSVNVRPMTDIRPATLPYGKVAVKVQSALSGRPSVNGIVPLRFTISVDGEEREKRTVLFRIEVLKEVLVTSRILARHKVIEADDVQLALRDIGMSTNIFSQKDDLIGKRTKRAISEGSIIAGNMVEMPPIIEQGDIVKIIIESPAFRITAQGKARQAGACGQTIRVVNMLSMKEISAQVIDENSVRVAF